MNLHEVMNMCQPYNPAMRTRILPVLGLLVALLASAFGAAPVARVAPASQQVPDPTGFFGFRIGTDGEMARYPRVLEYFQEVARQSDRVAYERLGETTMRNEYALLTISSPANLARLDRLVEINNRLADPRGLSDAEAQQLAAEGKPFYFLYATIHSTEIANGQAIIKIVHRLATEDSPFVRQILDDSVVLLVPSQNPDGQHLVIDHWYKTKDTPFNRTYPDLYHKYVGHDDNRDWFMFTQKETRMNIELVQNRYKPIITHDMHQMGGNGARIFVPPFTDPFDVNIHPLLALGQSTVGQAMATALLADNKTGVVWNQQYDMWTPARQYMVYHGQPRILTEIASTGALADPFTSPGGRPIGPQEPRGNFPVPYDKTTWTLDDMIDYGVIAALAGMSHVAKYGREWLYNFYQVHRDWVNDDKGPYAFVVPANQRDPYATYEMLEILEFGDVEIHRATAAFTAGGKSYPAGSYVIRTAQPYGAFAKTMLERQVYPDLRLFPGGPPEPPYDVTAHTLWMLMGVEVDRIEAPFEAGLEPVARVEPQGGLSFVDGVGDRPQSTYVIGPESYGVFKLVSELQKAGVEIHRMASSFQLGSRTFPPGTFRIPITPASRAIVGPAAKALGQVLVEGASPTGDAYQLKPNTRVGLFRGANNMPGGWMMWLLEQYGINHAVMKASDFAGDLNAQYDVILLPQGISRQRIVNGLDQRRNDPAEWGWAAGVGEEGWQKLGEFVRKGGTLLAIGSAVETARELLDLPIEAVLPAGRGFGRGGRGGGTPENPDRVLRDAFSSPARLMQVLRDRVADPDNLFYCPGSLLMNEFDTSNPIAWGMPESWPIFFEGDQAYRLRPGFGMQASVVARYPRENILASGWLLGEEYLRDQANVVSFRVGEGLVVTYGSQVDFRTQPRATFKLIFNAIYHGPSTRVMIR
jgi:hypothetical protein